MDLNATVEQWMPVVAAVVTVTSVLASAVNALVRNREAGGNKTPAWLLTIASGLNFCAANFDKALQFVKMAQGKPTNSTGGVINAPAALPADAPVAGTEAPKP